MEKVRERSISFSAESIWAIMEGRKTQTRRVIDVSKLRPSVWTHDTIGAFENSPNGYRARLAKFNVMSEPLKCPYGEPGFRLWVKEDFQPAVNGDTKEPLTIYRADFKKHGTESSYPKWRRARNMPKAAARLWLEVVSVNVEQLHSINWLNAWSEGFGPPPGNHPVDSVQTLADRHICMKSFENAWDELNAKTNPWASNPWVWAISFKVTADGRR